MTALIVVAAVGAAAIVAAAAAFVAKRRAERDGDVRVNAAVAELTTRVDELSAELRSALERAERHDARELTASIELEVVAAKVLEAATSLDGVDAVVLSLDGDEDTRLVAAVGVPQAEARAEAFDGPASRPGTRAAGRLEGELGPLGFLAVYSDSAEEHELRGPLEDLVRRASPAFENAGRYREARRLADHDALTGLWNRRYFHETLQRECARARRYGRGLALLMLDLDDFKSINERLGHLAGDAVLAEGARRLQSVVRASDLACRVGGDEFAIVLPEAGIADAEQLYRRIEDAVAERGVGGAGRLSFSAGVAELEESDDVKTLFERADDALYRAKNSGKGRVVAASTPADGE